MRSDSPILFFDIFRDYELEDIDEDSGRESEPDDQVTRSHTPLADPIKSLAGLGPVVTNLLSFLDPIDLARASCVCKHWNQVIGGDPRARRRKEIYVKDISELRSSFGKENWLMKESESVPPLVREPLRDLRSHQLPVRQSACDTPFAQRMGQLIEDDDVFCKGSGKRPDQPAVTRFTNIKSVGRTNNYVRVNRSSVDYKTPQFKSIRMVNCNSGGDTGSLIKHPHLQHGNHHNQRSMSGTKSISRRLLDDEVSDGMSQRRSSLAGSRSSKKNLRRL